MGSTSVGIIACLVISLLTVPSSVSQSDVCVPGDWNEKDSWIACASETPEANLPSGLCDDEENPVDFSSEPEIIWTPLMVINSPYFGSATKSSGTEVGTSFKIGTGPSSGFEVSHSDVDRSTVAITASGGNSAGLYAKFEWKGETYTDPNECPARSYWRSVVSDYTPGGVWTWHIKSLTGVDPMTDADNIAAPDFNGEGVFEIETRFEDPDAELCIEGGSGSLDWTFQDLVSTTVAATLSAGGTISGTMSSWVSTSTTYEYTLNEHASQDRCWEIDFFGEAWEGAAFAYTGPAGTGGHHSGSTDPVPGVTCPLDFTMNECSRVRHIYEDVEELISG